jgi:hypothetical protein
MERGLRFGVATLQNAPWTTLVERRASPASPLPGPSQYRRFGPRLIAHQAPPKQMAAMRQTIPRVG